LLPAAVGAAQEGRESALFGRAEAYIQVVSTRKLDELVKALGMTGIS
jgi:hypothetical protein